MHVPDRSTRKLVENISFSIVIFNNCKLPKILFYVLNELAMPREFLHILGMIGIFVQLVKRLGII